VRISLGIENTESDVDTFLNTLRQIAGKETLPRPASPSQKTQLKDFINTAEKKVYSP
jgi:hypothetical protein